MVFRHPGRSRTITPTIAPGSVYVTMCRLTRDPIPHRPESGSENKDDPTWRNITLSRLYNVCERYTMAIKDAIYGIILSIPLWVIICLVAVLIYSWCGGTI